MKNRFQITGEPDNTDYLVTLVRPDGKELSVLIPAADWRGWDVAIEGDSRSNPIGLNLVCDGHYI